MFLLVVISVTAETFSFGYVIFDSLRLDLLEGSISSGTQSNNAMDPESVSEYYVLFCFLPLIKRASEHNIVLISASKTLISLTKFYWYM